jgi:DNA-binding transcriptional LysR family regulator
MTADIDTRLLRSCLALAEHRHFGRAAAAMGISQPALSRQIALLERVVGEPLFERDRAGVAPTAAGWALLERARGIVDDVDAALMNARSAGRGEHGHLRLGVIASAQLQLLPRVLPRFTAAHPRVRLSLEEMPSTVSADAVSAGGIDVAIARGEPRGEHVGHLLSATVELGHVIAVVHRGHPLAGQKQIGVHQLAHWPLVLSPAADEPQTAAALRPVTETRPRFDEIIEGRGVHTIVTLAASGLGIGLGPDALRALSRHDVWMAEVTPRIELPPLTVTVRPPVRNPALRAFLRAVAAAVPEHAGRIDDLLHRAER